MHLRCCRVACAKALSRSARSLQIRALATTSFPNPNQSLSNQGLARQNQWPRSLSKPLSSPLTTQTRATHQSTTTMVSLRETINPTLLSGVREFWFEHLNSDDAFILLSIPQMMRWFQGGKELDEICVDRYLPVLDAIQASGITNGKDLVNALKLDSPSDWLSLILLLDQIPRNCHRGDAAKLVFTVFDPLARDVANLALERGVPETPEIRWAFARRMWFFLPLMHSEDPPSHETAVTEYQKMSDDVESLIAGKHATGDDSTHRALAARVLQADPEAARAMTKNQLSFELKHYDIIKEFGRYPHRNKAIGREMTTEEQKYLDNGGETFSG